MADSKDNMIDGTFSRYHDALVETEKGGKGSHQDKLYVYNRKGKECRFCHNLITKIVLNGRGTYFCPNCQKLNDDK